MSRLKSEVVCHLVLEGLDLRRKKLDHLAAFRTDHMIVMGVIVMVFVIGLIVAKSYFAGEAGLSEQL